MTTPHVDRASELRMAGRIIASFVSEDTSRRLDELARLTDTGGGKAFKGQTLNLARNANMRILTEMRAGAASHEQIQVVIQALAPLGKATTGAEVAPLFEGLRSGQRAA